MRSDEIFYRLFQEAPSSYFELIGAPAETAADYKFSAEELKHAGLRLDHLLLSRELSPRLVAAGIDRDARAREDASDHAPVWIEIA